MNKEPEIALRPTTADFYQKVFVPLSWFVPSFEQFNRETNNFSCLLSDLSSQEVAPRYEIQQDITPTPLPFIEEAEERERDRAP